MTTRSVKSFITNTSSNVIFFIVNSIIGFISIPIFINYMGNELYSLWLLNMTVMNYFIFLNTSLSGGIIKHVSESEELGDKNLQFQCINFSLLIYLIIGLLISIFLYSFSHTLAEFLSLDEDNADIFVAMISISSIFAVILWPMKVFEALFIGLMKQEVLNLVKGVITVSTSIILILMLSKGYSLNTLLYVFYILLSFIGLILILLYKVSNPQYKCDLRSPNKKVRNSILSFSFKLMILEFIAMLSFQVDTMILAYFLPVSYVAIYSIVTKLFYVLQGVYSSLLSSVQPVIFRACKSNDTIYIKSFSEKLFRYSLIFYTPIIYLSAIFARDFIFLWVGNEYSDYGLWSSVFILQYALSPVVGVLGVVSIGMNKIKYIQVYGVFSALLNLTLSIVLVKYYGFGGVILGTVISTYIGIFIIFPYYCRNIGINPKSIVLKNLFPFLAIVLIMLANLGLYSLVDIKTWFMFVSLFIIMVVPTMIVMSLFLYKEDHAKIKNMFLRRIR